MLTSRPANRHVLASLPLVLAIVLSSGPLEAGTIRDDVDDQLYLDLADSNPAYLATGRLRLSFSDGGGGTCSGTLIASHAVLTAAHCIDTAPTRVRFVDAHGVTHEGDLGRMWMHPSYTPRTPPEYDDYRGSYDIAVLMLEQPVASITPATRFSASAEVQSLGTIVGYGRTGDGDTGDTQPAGTRRAGRNIIDLIENDRDGGPTILLSDFDMPGNPGASQMGQATPQPLEYSTAPGDSGGGLYVESIHTYPRLMGVVAFSRKAPWAQTVRQVYGETDGFTRVSSFNDWINGQLGGTPWIGKVSDSAHDSRNWGDGRVPYLDPNGFGPVENVVFATAGSQRVDYAANNIPSVEYKFAYIDHGDFTFDNVSQLVAWQGFTLARHAGSDASLYLPEGLLDSGFGIFVGDAGRGTVTVGDGSSLATVKTGLAYIGERGYGELYLRNKAWFTATDHIFVGDEAGAYVRIDTDANLKTDDRLTISSEDFWARVSVNGKADVGSDLTIGLSANELGSLTVWADSPFSAGGTVDVGDQLYLARYENSHGEVTLGAGRIRTGTDPNAQDPDLEIGYEGTGVYTQIGGTTEVAQQLILGNRATGNGTLTLSGGSITVADFTGIGQDGVGTATVSGSGTLEIGRYLLVGDHGNSEGNLTVRDGGTVATLAGSLHVGHEQYSDGDLTVTGAGSRVDVAHSLFVGNKGDGYARIENGAVATVGDYAAVGFNLGSYGSLTVTGVGTSLTTTTDLTVGNFGSADAAFSDGASVNNANAVIGRGEAAVGELTVTGPGTSWTTGGLRVGEEGTGYLTLEDGATLHTAGNMRIGAQGTDAVGTVSVRDDASITTDNFDMQVGFNGTGTLNVSDTAFVSAAKHLVLGNSATGDGSVNQSGGTIHVGTATAGDLVVGWGGVGNYSLTGGTLSTTRHVSLAAAAGGSGDLTVDGAGTQFNSGGWITVGNEGVGVLKAVNGGTVTAAGSLSLGNASSASHGSANLSSGAVMQIAADAYVGASGTGVLTIADTGTAVTVGDDLFVGLRADGVYTQSGGAVTVAEHLYVAHEADSTGQVTLTGGTLAVDSVFLKQNNPNSTAVGSLQVGGSAEVTASGSVLVEHGAEMTIDYGGTMSIAGDLTVDTDSTATLNGGRLGVDRLTLDGAFVFLDGVLEVGRIDGGLTQEGGVLDLVTATDPTQVGSYDLMYGTLRLDIQSETEYERLLSAAGAINASQYSTLQLRFDDGYAPAIGDAYSLLLADELTAEFETIDAEGLDPALTLETRFETEPLLGLELFTLVVAPTLTGDFNADGVVDSADYTVYRDSYGQSGDGLAADANNDGTVDTADHAMWVSHYGDTLPPMPALFDPTQAVPEPAAAILAAMALVVRWRQRD